MPTWLAPNMVTLIGFFFIVGNVILLELVMPDLVGPVSSHDGTAETCVPACILRQAVGSFMAVFQLCFSHVDVRMASFIRLRKTYADDVSGQQVSDHGQHRWKASTTYKSV